MGRQPSPRFSVIKAMAQELGLERLTALEVESVRHREPPERLLAAIFSNGRRAPARLVSRLEREPASSLTKREREVMVFLTSGMSRQEIADELGISRETVKHHLRLIYARLGVHNQIQAINAFLEEEA